MSRYDKYEPFANGYRAPLAAAMDGTSANQLKHRLYGVGHDTNGNLVVGAGVTGIKGVFINHRGILQTGEVVDAMTSGEVVNFGEEAGGPAANAGANWYSDAAGVISNTATGVYVGHTVEATRLIVRVNSANAAA